MRLFHLALIAAFVFPLFATACGGGDDGGDDESFATYQDCYMDHHIDEGFDTPKAIEICCLDHPIGDQDKNVVCGDTKDSCVTYVTANLTDGSDANLPADIDAACTSYVTDRGN